MNYIDKTYEFALELLSSKKYYKINTSNIIGTYSNNFILYVNRDGSIIVNLEVL